LGVGGALCPDGLARESGPEAPPTGSECGCSSAFSIRAHIIGVSVNDTTSDIRIETASVMANSWNSRPTTSPMNSSGINTAMSETVSETSVNPICEAPFSAASMGGSPCSR
jgi:hypothetical protein